MKKWLLSILVLMILCASSVLRLSAQENSFPVEVYSVDQETHEEICRSGYAVLHNEVYFLAAEPVLGQDRYEYKKVIYRNPFYGLLSRWEGSCRYCAELPNGKFCFFDCDELPREDIPETYRQIYTPFDVVARVVADVEDRSLEHVPCLMFVILREGRYSLCEMGDILSPDENIFKARIYQNPLYGRVDGWRGESRYFTRVSGYEAFFDCSELDGVEIPTKGSLINCEYEVLCGVTLYGYNDGYPYNLMKSDYYLVDSEGTLFALPYDSVMYPEDNSMFRTVPRVNPLYQIEKEVYIGDYEYIVAYAPGLVRWFNLPDKSVLGGRVVPDLGSDLSWDFEVIRKVDMYSPMTDPLTRKDRWLVSYGDNYYILGLGAFLDLGDHTFRWKTEVMYNPDYGDSGSRVGKFRYYIPNLEELSDAYYFN